MTPEDRKQVDLMHSYALKGNLPVDLVLAMGYVVGLIGKLEDTIHAMQMHIDDVPTYEMPEEQRGGPKPIARNKDSCRRGTATVDAKGKPFQHEIDGTLGYCLWCGLGAPESKPDPAANLLARGMIETVACDEHGSHRIEVKPDGTFDKPDCKMFGVRHEGLP